MIWCMASIIEHLFQESVQGLEIRLGNLNFLEIQMKHQLIKLSVISEVMKMAEFP